MSHYFSPDAEPLTNPESVTVELAGRSLEVFTAPGVFAGGRVDAGTAVLLRTMARQPPLADRGTFLDLGCGWGPIALTMAMASPGADVYAVDVNPRAVQLTAANASRLGLSRVRALTPDRVPGDLRFDRIWSNPPIRIGKSALHELLATWLARLTPDGCADLVIQRHLGADSLQAWMADELSMDVTRTASAKGYRVLTVRRPGQQGGSTAAR